MRKKIIYLRPGIRIDVELNDLLYIRFRNFTGYLAVVRAMSYTDKCCIFTALFTNIGHVLTLYQRPSPATCYLHYARHVIAIVTMVAPVLYRKCHGTVSTQARWP